MKIDYSTNRALVSGINNSGWTAEEIRKGLSKQYKVNVVYVARFLYSKKGYKFLENQTKSYFPYWGMKKTAVQALRSAIVLDSVGRQAVFCRHHEDAARGHASG